MTNESDLVDWYKNEHELRDCVDGGCQKQTFPSAPAIWDSVEQGPSNAEGNIAGTEHQIGPSLTLTH